MLVTSSSYDKFRIVIENYSGNRGEIPFDILPTEEIVEYLREVGCKVPVLMYSDYEYNQEKLKQVMKLKKQYNMLFSSNEIKDLKNFCKMK